MDAVSKLKGFLSQEISDSLRPSIKEVDVDQDLLEDGIIDSMLLLKLVSFVEETFSVKIFDEDITKDNFKSLRSIENLILRKQTSKTVKTV